MSKANDDAPLTGSSPADSVESPGLDVKGSDTTGVLEGASERASFDGASRRSRRAAETPVDAVPEQRRERESQARARNREALRAYRALAESQAVQGEDGARVETPTRRQLRLQQAQTRMGAPGSADVDTAAQGAPSTAPGAVARAEDEAAGAEAGIPSAVSEGLAEVLPGGPAASAGAVRTGASVARPSGEPLPGGRRDRRRQQTAPTVAVQAGADPAITTTADAPKDRSVEDMTVEEALAARQAIVEDAREHAAELNASGADDPFTVNLEVLSQQKALAERAAVLNSRARRMQELSEQNQQRRPAANDPTTAHNLSIVAPPEFVRVPGAAQSVLRAPSTSHVPVVLPRPRRAPAAPPTARQEPAGAEREEEVDGGEETEPIKARSAFGLEPLDAMTAGLGRLRRLRYIQYSLLGVGAGALTTGIIMTVSSLNG
ncbi:hypothetical protein FDK12_09345 [Arthrobacter sp. NamB2]|uniref:hypothetical protein n=1 Tax=Arthrobacter sp. NamB2 TaxID=2576035 RepID=UPI0010C96344|nr:hypothetical protein [Arthrobacter sp. NamB2]TKV28164.1 hypothetical protein FDK12_09345 [Arthrobacter sp. NamB2]